MIKSDSTAMYKERVLPSMAFFFALLFLPMATIAVLLPFSEILAITGGILSYIFALAITWRLAPLISINQTSLRVGNAVIEASYLGVVSVVETHEAFVERGRNLNPKAYTRFQIGVNQLVKIEIQDEADPTPYWLVSTRNPELVKSFLQKIS
jgi:hypothetical protein